jgi:hypothetical protein
MKFCGMFSEEVNGWLAWLKEETETNIAPIFNIANSRGNNFFEFQR